MRYGPQGCTVALQRCTVAPVWRIWPGTLLLLIMSFILKYSYDHASYIRLCTCTTFFHANGNVPVNKWLNCGDDPDRHLDTGIIFLIRYYCGIRKDSLDYNNYVIMLSAHKKRDSHCTARSEQCKRCAIYHPAHACTCLYLLYVQLNSMRGCCNSCHSHYTARSRQRYCQFNLTPSPSFSRWHVQSIRAYTMASVV